MKCECCGKSVNANNLREFFTGIREGKKVPLCQCVYTSRYFREWIRCNSCGEIHPAEELDGNGYCQCCASMSYVKSYGYKPTPIFKQTEAEKSDYYQLRYFGLEIEIDDGYKRKDVCEELSDEFNKLFYFKRDGSLSEMGIECVSHPMTLAYAREFDWRKFSEICREGGYKSHDTNTCGFHIHVNRDSIGYDEEVVARILYFVERHWTNIIKFSRRKRNLIDTWAGRFDELRKAKSIHGLYEDYAKETDERHKCVNITNDATIEFRIFRGTLNPETILASIEFVDAICNVCVEMSDREIQKMTWRKFCEYISKRDYPELVRYMVRRKLYM